MIGAFGLGLLLSSPVALPAVPVANDCSAVDTAAFERLLALELALVPGFVWPPSLALRLQCDEVPAGADVRIVLADPRRGAMAERRVVLPPGDPEAERVLALATIDLLTTAPTGWGAWPELPPAAAQPAQPVPAAEPTPVSPPTVPSERTVPEERGSERPPVPKEQPKAQSDARRSLWFEVAGGYVGRALERAPAGAGHVQLHLLGWFDEAFGVTGVVSTDVSSQTRLGGRALAWSVAAGAGVALRSRPRRLWRWLANVYGTVGYSRVGARPESGYAASNVDGVAIDLALRTGPRVRTDIAGIGLDLLLGGGLRHPVGLVAEDDPVTLGGVFVGVMTTLSFTVWRDR